MSDISDCEGMSYEDGIVLIDDFFGTDETASPAQEGDWTRPAMSYHDTRGDSGQQNLQQPSPAVSFQEAPKPASSGYSQFGTPTESDQSARPIRPVDDHTRPIGPVNDRTKPIGNLRQVMNDMSPEGSVVLHGYGDLFKKESNGWACRQCGVIVKLDSRSGHYRSHVPENLRCPVRSCEQEIKRRHSLVNHLRTHDLCERAKCPACPLVVSLALLRVHVRKDHTIYYGLNTDIISLLPAFEEYIKKSERCPLRGCTRAHRGCRDPLDAIREHGEDLSVGQTRDLESKHFFLF